MQYLMLPFQTLQTQICNKKKEAQDKIKMAQTHRPNEQFNVETQQLWYLYAKFILHSSTSTSLNMKKKLAYKPIQLETAAQQQ